MTKSATYMDRILAPRSVAIIGASDNPLRIGGRPIASLLKAGYRGDIFPVNPNRDTVQGLKCYHDVSELPEAPDAALVAVPMSHVGSALDALGRKGCKAVTLFSSGFAETGADGVKAQSEIVAIARRYGMRLLGPNTLGVFNVDAHYFGTFSSSFDTWFPLSGNIGIVSQSGAFGAHLAVLARMRSLGTSALIATGNEADLTVADAIEWMVADSKTDVICAYLEAINDGPTLLRAVRAAIAAGKTTVLLKAGSSDLGARAAASHTASLAGDFAVAQKVLADEGALMVNDAETMMDYAYLASRKVFPKKRSLGVVTVSGGAGIMASDEADRIGMPMPAMPDAAQAALTKILPFSAPSNPIDCTAQAVNDLSLLETFTRSTLEHGNYGAVLCFLTYIAGSPVMADAIIKTLKPLREEYPDVLMVLCAIGEPEVLQRYEDAGICVFADVVRAVRAMDAICRVGIAAADKRKTVDLPPQVHLALPPKTPNEAEAKLLLQSANIASVPEFVAKSPDEAIMQAERIGFPVVMKILSADIVHKSDMGAVKLGIGSAEEVRTAYGQIEAAVRSHAPLAKLDGILVAKQLSGGVECFMGVKQDPAFGPVAAFGLGGIYVEILKDVVLRKCPFDQDIARETILSINSAGLLTGARGRPPADIDALSKMFADLSQFAVRAGDRLVAIDLNPVVAMPQGQGAWALDAVVELLPEGGDE